MAARVYSLKKGPISVQIEANKKFMVLLSKSVQNRVIRDSLNAAGIYWANVFLPKRFTKYALSVLGYNPSIAWQNAKVELIDAKSENKRSIAPQPLPLVYSGDMRRTALEKWNAKSVGQGKRQGIVVKIPLGHAVKKHVVNVITNVPRLELQRITDVFAKELPKRIANAYGPQLANSRPSGRAGVRSI